MSTKAAEQIQKLGEKVKEESLFLNDLENEVRKNLVGQEHMFSQMMVALLCKGHILLEGVPGLAKTLAINALASAIKLKFSRIQFTPDLLPSDVVGTMIFNQAKGDFSPKLGPIFANLVLADEINRAPAKVQSALLEAMQEKQITIGEKTHKLEEPFMVMATQNPIDQEGTYQLPEAQVDRFMLKILVDYPSKEEESRIVEINTEGGLPNIQPVIKAQQILQARETVSAIYLDEKIRDYIVDLVHCSRNPNSWGASDLTELIAFGASPRGSIALAQASKAKAYLSARGFVIPEDVRAVAKDVLRHRIGLSYEAEAENVVADSIIDEILETVPVP